MLHGNGSVFHKIPARFIGGSTTSVEPQLRSAFGKAGMLRNRFYQDGQTTSFKLYSIPEGSYAPSGSQVAGSAWMLPQRGGAMSSVNLATLSITPSSVIYGGITTTGTATLSINTNTPEGQLITFGAGLASFTLNTNNPLLTAVLNAIGSANFTLTGSGATLNGFGSASGASSFAITGYVTPYAIGSMSGSTVDTTTLTAASILAAMNAAPPAVNIKKVNDVVVNGVGSAANPWGA